MKNKFLNFISVTLLIFPLLCVANQTTNEKPLPSNTLFQVSVINALAQGVYDGDYSYQSLMNIMTPHTIGVGTFQHLDGEMVAVDGHYYQIKADGHLSAVNPNQLTPFAEIANMDNATSYSVANIASFNDLSKLLLSKFKNPNIPYAIRIDGDFDDIKMRTVKAQKKPYPPLQVAAKSQSVFEMKNQTGSIVGFWFPAYWGNIAVPGFHLHFVTSDKQTGGHILEVNIKSGHLSITPINHIEFYLPHNKEFSQANLQDKNLNQQIQSAESDHKK